MEYIKSNRKKSSKESKINFEGMQPGDVEATFANCENLEKWIGYKPNTSIDERY